MAKEHDLNLDPLSKEPGAHPVGTGLGAAAGGAAAGAAVGVMAGPVGAVVGAVVGGVAGGLGGKAVAEAVNPTAEEAHWQDNYHRESYYEPGRPFTDYAPAYRLGWQARSENQGQFDQSEERLASRWDAAKADSTLTWPQARMASRAAWDRVDSRVGAGTMDSDRGDFESMDDSGDNSDTVSTLNNLLESCRDGEYGFGECAEHTRSPELKARLLRYAEECRKASKELQGLIAQLGGDADEGGSFSGALHRGWVSVRGTLSGYSDQAMLDECERGEDVALASYRKALKQNLPPMVKTVVARQAQGVQSNHDEIKRLRDTLQAS